MVAPVPPPEVIKVHLHQSVIVQLQVPVEQKPKAFVPLEHMSMFFEVGSDPESTPEGLLFGILGLVNPIPVAEADAVESFSVVLLRVLLQSPFYPFERYVPTLKAFGHLADLSGSLTHFDTIDFVHTWDNSKQPLPNLAGAEIAFKGFPVLFFDDLL